eukprot:symbB.v1.2.010901.t2/scaffold720.1/size169259/12
MLRLLLSSCSASLLVPLAFGLPSVPSTPFWFQQKVSHFSASNATYWQRYYINEDHWAGPGNPIFVIMGGEGGISPETGIFYPWVTDILAKEYRGLVIQPEHRFYGESLPFGNASYLPINMRAAMNTQEALADAAELIRDAQKKRRCTEGRGTEFYCPVLVLGGSYPGFLAAMMRMRYPAVVDMAYASSAPLRFYSQEVSQYEYYAKVTESAERSVKGCAGAVKKAFDKMVDFFKTANTSEILQEFSVCNLPQPMSASLVADNLLFLAEQTFANLNMGNYPPNSETGLHRTCKNFIKAVEEQSELVALKNLLLQETRLQHAGLRSGRAHLGFMHQQNGANGGCFDLSVHLPAGDFATARCGDWSGCGYGHDGQMWDFQTCSFEVEHIGFGTSKQMFPSYPWTSEWLHRHCWQRFNVTPQPTTLAQLWGFDSTNLARSTSRIVFVNGLNDGWSVGGILHSLSVERGLIAINLPNGAHHSELSHSIQDDTPDVKEAHERILGLVGQWLEEIRNPGGLTIESPTEEGILDGKRRAAFRVIYAARRAFVEYSAAVRIQKVVRGAIARMQLQRQIGEIADQSAVKLQALARGRLARAALRKELAAATRIQAHARGMFARLQTQALQEKDPKDLGRYEGDFRLMPQSEWQRIYGRFEATPREAIAVRAVPKGDFRCMLPSAWDSIYARFKVAEAVLAEHQQLSSSQERIEADTNCQRPSTKQDGAAGEYVLFLTRSQLEAALAKEKQSSKAKVEDRPRSSQQGAAKEYVSFLTRAQLEAAVAKADAGPTLTVTSEKDDTAHHYVSFLTRSQLEAALAQKQRIVASQDQAASKLEAELATEQVHASSKTKERMADGDFRTLPAAAWHCIHARFEVDRPDVTSPLHCLSVTSEALDAVATSTSKALVATSIEEMADAIDSPNVDRVHSPVTSPASPASQYVSFLTSLHLQETAEDDPLHPNSQASIASQHESPFTSVQLEASIGDDPHQASSYLEASPASQYEAAEDDPLHPNSQASIASQHESPFTSVQLEASIGDPHQVSSHLEASPSSQHNVDEDLRLQVSIDDPHVPSGELEDVSSSVVSPRVDITTHDLDAITVEDNMSSSTRRMDISQDTWRLATPMSQASEVVNLDASQDTGFLCKEVVDTAVFEGVRDLKPGTPEFHQEDTSLVVTAPTFREEVDDAVLESILANALRVPPGCDSSEVGRPPERESNAWNSDCEAPKASPMSGATVNDHEVATEVAPEVASLVLNNSLPRSTSKVNSEVSEVVDGSNVGEAAIARSVEEVVTSMQGPISPQSPQWANSSLGIEDVGASVQGLDDAITDIHKEIEAMVPQQ